MTPAKRGKGNKANAAEGAESSPPVRRSRHRASRDINASLHVVACIKDPVVIEKILAHLDSKVAGNAARPLTPCRAPSQASLFAWHIKRASKSSGCATERHGRCRIERSQSVEKIMLA